MGNSDETGKRRALLLEAQERGHEAAQELYRSIVAFRDGLPAPAKKELAAALEWAREGIHSLPPEQRTVELLSLADAYAFARDLLLSSIDQLKR